MTAAEIERLAVLETKVDGIERRLSDISCKLDLALETKADKADVATMELSLKGKADSKDFQDLRKLIIGILVASAAFAITTLVGLFMYVAQGHLALK